jgi:DNA polymerase-3 subunit delta'
MIDLLSLIKDTSAYRTVLGDKERDTLSHAYLLLTADGDYLDEYLKVFTKLMLCDAPSYCNECRVCRLVDEWSFADVYYFPKNGEAITAEEINTVIEESYLKPIEGKKKVFVLSHAERMNLSAQNKLLKTLEEPPAGVHILIGATSEFPLLPTVKSRVKKLELPAVSGEKLFDALKGEYPDKERLLKAIACGDGTVGKAVSLYSDEKLKEITDLVVDMLVNMKSSSQTLDYSGKILKLTPDPAEFISVTELMLRDLLLIRTGNESEVFSADEKSKLKRAEGFTEGAILYALDSIHECGKRKKFNANPTMLIEWLLMQILEGRYKWQKL